MKRLIPTDQLFQAPIFCALVLGIASSSNLRATAADFTDANWISMGGIPGTDYTVYAGVIANRIAKWNGSWWTALGSGMGGINPNVFAMAVSGSDLYAGGNFTTAGGIAATNIAKWNGVTWSALGSGMN